MKVHAEEICKWLEMQRDCALRIAGRRRLPSFSVEYKTGCPRQTSHRGDLHIVRNARVHSSASSAAIQAQVETSLRTPVSSRTIRRHLVAGHLGLRRPLRVQPLTPTHRRLRLDWCHTRGNWTEAEGSQVVFNDESRFNLSSDDNSFRR
ncbi:transposable element Tcb2 transposase [Trichonephila clavipes]|nr:transposable element Tcb2 transposase [Trichonephila clavipes]